MGVFHPDHNPIPVFFFGFLARTAHTRHTLDPDDKYNHAPSTVKSWPFVHLPSVQIRETSATTITTLGSDFGVSTDI